MIAWHATHRRLVAGFLAVALASLLSGAVASPTAAAVPIVTPGAAGVPGAVAPGALPGAVAVPAPQWEPGLRSYFVVTAPGDVSPAVSATRANGGSVFAAYPAIGVVVAHGTSADFAHSVRQAPGVQQAGATRTSDIPKQAYEPAVPPRPPQHTPMGPERPRWNLTQIGADKSLPVVSGSRDVVVGVLDTGVDGMHAELDDAFDASRSASCAYGSLDRRDGAWRDTNSHGTHVAGTIAAAKDGVGVLGVAPGITVASVRVAEQPTGLFFPENAVCAFMFAAQQGFDVTNNSYYIDPWQYLCPDDPDQAAILEAVRRAVRHAERKGMLHVAAAGNSDYNLANKTTDSSSPNDSKPIENRPLTADCIDLPTELPGVVTVSATGREKRKASYSNYGTDKIDITAPGGDPGKQDQGVLSTVPGGRYGFKAGTSMAAPHVTGVAALLASAHPEWTPAQLRQRLLIQARDLDCADDDRCAGDAFRNSFYGEGIVDAAAAVGAGTR